MIARILCVVVLMNTLAMAGDTETIAELQAENASLKAQLFDLQQKVSELEALIAENNVDVPATQPVVNASGNTRKEWTLTIISNEPADFNWIVDQLTVEQSKMPGIEARLSDAKFRSDSISGKTESFITSSGRVGTKKSNNSAEIGKARVELQRIENERKQTQSKIKRLERELVEAKTAREVTAILDDNTPVVIVPLSQAQKALMELLEVNKTYLVTGPGVTKDGATTIRVHSVKAISE